MKTTILILIFLFGSLAYAQENFTLFRDAQYAYQSATLTIEQLTPKTYVHTSTIDIPNLYTR